jgi:hypothetical protein
MQIIATAAIGRANVAVRQRQAPANETSASANAAANQPNMSPTRPVGILHPLISPPAAPLAVTVMTLDSELPFASDTIAGANEHRTVAGRPVHDKSTLPLNPVVVTTLTFTVPDPPSPTVNAPGETFTLKSATVNCVALPVLDALKFPSPA